MNKEEMETIKEVIKQEIESRLDNLGLLNKKEIQEIPLVVKKESKEPIIE